jgi:hypothetical protein
VEHNTLKLYTIDDDTYHSNDAITDNRDLKILWYNKSEDNEYIGFGDGIADPSYDEENYL